MRKFQHPSTAFFVRAPLALAVLTLVAAGCRCGPPETKKNLPDYIVSQTALSFEACPSQDDQGNAVADVFPDRQTVTVENIGKVGGLLQLTIEGNGADRFKIVEATKVESINAGTSAEIEIEFSPAGAGDATASLVVDDGEVDTEPVRVALQGTGINLPAQPTIKVSYEDATGNFTDCVENFNGQIDNCLVAFPDTFLDQSARLKLKIKNTGCPSLKVTDLSLSPLTQGSVVQFFIEQPAVLPSTSTPATLNVIDGNAEMEVLVRFDPKDDGTNDGQRYGVLTVKSNAQKSPESLITLFGYAAQPAIYVTPSFCDFTDSNDNCGGTKMTTTGTNARATFQITNGGNTPVVIDSVAFRQPTSGRFTIAGTNPQGATIAAGASQPLQIDYTDQPVYVTDLIDIVASSQGMPAGKSTVRVSGGILPDLSTVPATQLDFSDTTTATAVKPVQICNGSGAGTLVIQRVQVTQSTQFFKVATPVNPGTQVDAGQCVSVDIEFTRPVSGGLQAGTLEIETNDPDFAAPSYYRLNLYSDVPVDQLPVAVLTGPGPDYHENAFSVSLQTLNPKRVTLEATKSYDPPTNAPATEYQFYLGKKPSNATASITQGTTNVDGVKTTTGTVDLNLDPTITGEYRVYVRVYDSAGQASANTAELKILVNQ